MIQYADERFIWGLNDNCLIVCLYLAICSAIFGIPLLFLARAILREYCAPFLLWFLHHGPRLKLWPRLASIGMFFAKHIR